MVTNLTFRSPWLALGAAAALSLAPAGMAQAGATSPAAIVAPPGSTATGFLPPQVAITAGGSLSLSNFDTTTHNLACQQRDPVTFQPICQSPYANPQQTVTTAGVSSLAPGSYALECQLHPQMTATLTVTGAAAE